MNLEISKIYNYFRGEIFNLETNETINIFNSICEAAKLQKLNRNHISEVCNGKRNSYNGFGWEFIILRD